MTYRSNVDWDYGQPVTNTLIEDIVRGLKHNREYNRTQRGKDKYFYIHSYETRVDGIILNIGNFLDYNLKKKEPITKEKINELTSRSNAPQGIREIYLGVLSHMGILSS